MSGLILLIGENPQAQEPLIQNLKSDGFSVLPVRTLPEALTHLRNPAFTVAAVVWNVGMRRQQDLDTMLEICASRPHLPLILAVNELLDLHSELRTSIRGLHILRTPLAHQDSYLSIREIIDSARFSPEKDKHPDPELQTRILIDEISAPEVQAYSESFLSRVGMADVPVLLH